MTKKCAASAMVPPDNADTLPYEASPVAKALSQTAEIAEIKDSDDEDEAEPSLKRSLLVEFSQPVSSPEKGRDLSVQ